VAFGDKASGPNHVLPTAGAARYTGGLNDQIIRDRGLKANGQQPTAKGSRKNKFDAPRAPRRNSVKKRGGRIH